MKDKQLNVRVSAVFAVRLSDHCRARGQGVSEFVVQVLTEALDGGLRSSQKAAGVPEVLPPVHGGSQSDRAAYARSLLVAAKPEVAHTVQMPTGSGRVARCEHGMIFENCDQCNNRI